MEMIKKFREKHNLSQEKLARMLDVSTASVYNWETGRRSVPSMLHLALDTIEKNLGK